MFPIEKLDRIVREETGDVKSVVHDYGHLKRVAIGSAWFVRILGGTKEEEELAHAAGLLHDIVRPASEKVCHAEASGNRSEEILRGVGIDGRITERIVEAVKSHRSVHEWKTPLHQSVFLADKILEQMGAYVAFRRSYYVGECRDYEGKDPMESILSHFDYRTKKFNKDSFAKSLLPLVEYQYGKLLDFNRMLVEGVPWGRDLALYMHSQGRKKEGFEESVKGFRPENQDGEDIKSEALLYMEGKLFPSLERILKK